MSYEKIDQFVLYMRWMQEKELDIFAITTAPKGFGKSTAGVQFARSYVKKFGLTCLKCNHSWMFTGSALIAGEYGEFKVRDNLHEPCPKCKNTEIERTRKFNFMTYLSFDLDEVRKMIYDLPPFSPLLPDEGVNFMMGEDWNVYENKEMKKLVALMRTKRLMVLTNIQRFKWTDSKYRNDMSTFWIRILRRGHAILLQPDLGEADDPWYLKDFQKLLGSYFYFTSDDELDKKADKIVARHRCAFDHFRIPPLPEEIYKEYLKARTAKVFTRKDKDQTIDQKQLAKISAYNFIHRWEEIKGAIKIGRFERPTLKILEEFIFSDPKSKEHVVRYTTLRNWINEIKRIALRSNK